MKHKFAKREVSLAIAALVTMTALGTATGVASAAGKAAGTYVTGDFHNHTTCSDGTLSLKKLVNKSVDTFGLDWFVQAGHGGSSSRNCTLSEDPFEPVAPALGLSSNSTGPYPPFTYPGGGQPATTAFGPNQLWQDTLPGATLADRQALIKGLPNGNLRAMWKWQEIKEYIYPMIEQESRNRDKPIFVGLEQVVPGHEHSSTPSSTPNAESEPFSRCALNEINNLVMRGEVSVVAMFGVRSAGNIRRQRYTRPHVPQAHARWRPHLPAIGRVLPQ